MGVRPFANSIITLVDTGVYLFIEDGYLWVVGAVREWPLLTSKILFTR